MTFKDVMGTDIKENDYVIFFDANRNATVRPLYCKVVGFTPKKVRISYLVVWSESTEIKTKLVESDTTKLIVVNDLIMTMSAEKYEKTFKLLE